MRTFFFRRLPLLILLCGVIAAPIQAPAVYIAPAPTGPQAVQSLPIPPQDQGLPYTRTSHSHGLSAIKDDIAVFAGSRFGCVHGLRVRLDDTNITTMLHAEAVSQDNKIFVPKAFAGYLTLKEIKGDTPPDYLACRWVYTIGHPKADVPANVQAIEVKGVPCIDLAAYAKSLGLKTYQNSRGLLLISDKDIAFNDSDEVLSDCVVTLFDTPEKLADPEIATKYVPMLKAQGAWTDHVKVTPEQLKLLDGPETDFPLTPESEYDLSGFNAKLLGSKVPPPGVYPRVLFSPEDIPMMQELVKNNKINQMAMAQIEALFKKSWWDPTTSDGQIFVKLSTGDVSGLAFPDAIGAGYAGPGFIGQKPGIANHHIAYVSNSLTTMALYCLLTDNDELGKKAATAIYNYYKLREPALDKIVAMSDTEFGQNADWANFGETSFRGLHGFVGHMDLPFALDFGGKWMTPEQKALMYRFIAKATYGRRVYGQEGPSRWRDNNQVTWHLTDILAQVAIEGQAGYDPEVVEMGKETLRSFYEFGIDKYGQIFESNGKNGGGLEFGLLTTTALARRGDNMWGHPHLRKMLEAQVYTTAPNGKATLSGGTWGGGAMDPVDVGIIAAFYPQDKYSAYLLTNSEPDRDWSKFDVAAYREQLAAKIPPHMILPGPVYSGFSAFPYSTDWKQTRREDLDLPLDWNDPVHGMFSSSSDKTENASWLSFQVRPNHYIGSGHHHADEGMFYFSGLGVNWITISPFQKTYDGRLHNEVLIDGLAENNGPPAKAKYLGAALSPEASFAAADLSYAYSWQWITQLTTWDTSFFVGVKPLNTLAIELETDPDVIAIFKGTQHYKLRTWWPTYNFSNWLPTLRAPWNPVEYVYRSVGLVRGAHPYSLIVDDAKKDDTDHLYQWTAMRGEGVAEAKVPGLAAGDLALGQKSELEGGTPKNGASLLLVHAFSDTTGQKVVAETMSDGPSDPKKGPQPYDRISISVKGKEAHYKVALIPFKMGESLPAFSYDAGKGAASVKWNDQEDAIKFTAGDDHRTKVRVERGGKSLVQGP